jgi:hypothetical protein
LSTTSSGCYTRNFGRIFIAFGDVILITIVDTINLVGRFFILRVDTTLNRITFRITLFFFVVVFSSGRNSEIFNSQFGSNQEISDGRSWGSWENWGLCPMRVPAREMWLVPSCTFIVTTTRRNVTYLQGEVTGSVVRLVSASAIASAAGFDEDMACNVACNEAVIVALSNLVVSSNMTNNIDKLDNNNVR